MKLEVGDRVVHYGRKGVVVARDPATRKYMVDFATEKEQIDMIPVYESELTKIEPEPVA